MAKSPSTTACSSDPAKAAQVFTPIVLPMTPPCMRVVRPITTLYTPSLRSPFSRRIASIFAGSSEDLAGSISAWGASPLPPLVSLIFANTFPTAAESPSSLPIPPMCMNMTLGVSQRKWLCSAVTSRPLSRAALMTGFTWSSSRTMSPMTTVCRPTCWNEAHDVRPIGGVRCTPATRTSRSSRGTETLKTPSFGSSFPLAPVSSSIRTVSSCGGLVTGAPAALVTAAIRINAGANSLLIMVPP